MTEWELVDDIDAVHSAEEQMRADLDLLERAGSADAPVLRLYTWSRPALSLGRFQPDADVDHDACERRGVEVVRRPTGGRALLHGGDLTYAVALPQPGGVQRSVDTIYRFVAAGLIAGLARLTVDAQVARHEGGGGPVCFSGQEGSDLRVGTRKVCGSAQVHRESAVLQHGSILLHRLDYDETDLIHGRHDPEALRRATVTTAELGASSDPRVVGAALVAGFRAALDLQFTSKTSVGAGPVPVGPRVDVPEGR
jgi:lipoate-protein ligase A